jgi:hypothetical protein
MSSPPAATHTTAFAVVLIFLVASLQCIMHFIRSYTSQVSNNVRVREREREGAREGGIGDELIRGFQVSLYADDAAIFVGLDLQDLIAITTILTCFGGATGLKTNLRKTDIFPRL